MMGQGLESKPGPAVAEASPSPSTAISQASPTPAPTATPSEALSPKVVQDINALLGKGSSEATTFDEAFRRGAYNGRGQVYNALKQYGKAIADLSEAIGLKSDFAEAYYNRAVAYEALGQDEKASNDYIAVIRLKKSDHLPKAAP
jgi:tetratricopeptide (TPR) repeat protein